MFVIQQHSLAKTDYLLSRVAVEVESGKGSEYGYRLVQALRQICEDGVVFLDASIVLSPTY